LIHDVHGWWIADAGAPAPQPALAEAIDADVVVVGGGYTGLWTAWEIAEAEPNASVVVLEAERCGMGPSGRNGGFLSSLWLYLPLLREQYGEARARELCEASVESVRAIGAWCEAQEVDAWYREAPHLVVSCAPRQDGASAGAVTGDEVIALSAAETRAVCDSPVFRGGVATREGATVHPARLAFGLRERLLARGVRIFEGSAVRALRAERADTEGPGVVVAETAGGHVRAGAAVVAVNAASGQIKRLRNRLTVSSSHIVLTEPVPDVIDALGWTGGEAITDGRALLHYFRTTRDGRILFGWGGGRMAAGARTGGRMDFDPDIVAETQRSLERIFPALAGRRIEHAWGGPIDVSPTHLPSIVTLSGGRAWAAFGYTGNGVGPSHLAARSLASLALGRRDAAARWAWIDPPPRNVPPEPLRVAGATVLRAALARSEAAAENGGRADPVSEALAALPAKLGLHIVR
jgi:glycine/D-amino acid oxidase-like deaminating enzyme